jgi:uncharacterized protein YbjT (DUF2867 family)
MVVGERPVPRQVLVLGAAGRFGGVADGLLRRGHQVRAATRDPAGSRARRIAALGAELVRADFDDVGSIRRAARGVDTVVASGTAHRAGIAGEVRHGRNLALALAATTMARLILISGAGSDRPTNVPVLEAKRQVEAFIRALDIPTCVIAPTYLMENLYNPWNLAWLRSGVLPSAISVSTPLQQVATEDVVALVVHLVENEQECIGQRIDIASDELNALEAAQIWSAILGRLVAAHHTPRNSLSTELQQLFVWLEQQPFAVDIPNLKNRFPSIHWRGYSQWVAERVSASYTHSSPHPEACSCSGDIPQSSCKA